MDYREEAQRQGENLMSSAKNALDDVRHHAGEYYEQGKERARDVQRKLERNIVEAPFTSVSTACGIGLALGVGIGLLIGASLRR